MTTRLTPPLVAPFTRSKLTRPGRKRAQGLTAGRCVPQTYGWGQALRKPAAAGSRGCGIGVFREGKMEIPVKMGV